MKQNNTLLTIGFKNSKKEVEVSLDALNESTVDFLENFGNVRFTGKTFSEIIRDGDGKSKFVNLLAATGNRDNPAQFFKLILDAVAESKGHKIQINGVSIPSMYLVSILEQVIPGNGYVSIHNTSQLETETNLHIPENQQADLQKVIEKFPVRLSRHTIRQLMVSQDVAYQYLPFVEELDLAGFVNTWIGQFHDGLLEQMYQNRVIFLLNMSCPVYCRFCFRKHKDSRNEKNPTPKDVEQAIDHVQNSPSIKEIVVTGGDPFLNRKNMDTTLNGLADIDHVQTLRLATRSVAYYPDLFIKNESEYLKYLKQKNYKLQRRGKRMELATHFIHPDEISPESLEIISELVGQGVAVYIQTPFLKECNDSGPELVKLFGILRSAGAELHYIYIPCSPIHGNSVYWKPISGGIIIASYLRAHLSDRAIPSICTATPIGKMDWFSSGWAVERVEDNDNFLWFRTPYTMDYFKPFAPLEDLSNIRLNNHGTLDIQYMAQIGNDNYLMGERPPKTAEKNDQATEEEIKALQKELSEQRQTARSIVNTGLDNICRLHETRVEVSAKADDAEIQYIKSDYRISDVIISANEDAVSLLHTIKSFALKLQEIPHVTSLRLRSMKLSTAPSSYSRHTINALGDLNRLSVTNPVRLEIETWFMSADEITDEHRQLVRRLNNKGITVYCNTPLLGGVNDNAEAIHELAYKVRKTSMEFHHLYVAGLPIQNNWNANRPIDSYDVVEIATKVRREGSGREIPRYIIFTPLGEVDYGLTSSFVKQDGDYAVRLGCYNEAYYQGMDTDFSFPDGVTIENGSPVVTVPGLLKTNDFPIS